MVYISGVLARQPYVDTITKQPVKPKLISKPVQGATSGFTGKYKF